MGNGLFRATTNCLPCAGSSTAGHASAVVTSEPYDEGVGHSFFYHTDNPTTFRSISGASVSANASTHLSTALLSDTTFPIAASIFDCSTSFSSAPLHPVSRFSSAPLDRGFLSGPLNPPSAPLRRTLSLQPFRTAASSLLRSLTKKQPKISVLPQSENDELISQSSNLHWAEGKAGEDRVHVIISEEQEWVFVGIYDGFNGPDATDYLLSNLYSAVQLELKGLLSEASIKHSQVLKALSRALKKTEEEYLDVADRMVNQNPELALMGSTVLLMVMKGEDVYLMNVGDSRAVVARMPDRELAGKETMFDSLVAMQLTLDHSTSIKEEVRRIRKEHPDDVSAIVNDRVKGSLRVTRAFGAGFLKKPKWNNALLEMFRIDYVGTKPYISCSPFLHHHRLGPSDKFLILSSDGLYQYFTNEDAVAQVELFIATNCEGDPAQHLVEEVLFRAAEKAGLDFHQLLEIRQGDRRQYHDDISVIVISLEGRIWRSSM